MEKLDWSMEGLRNGCILAGIAHAIGAARYPAFAGEKSWDKDGTNYSIRDGEGSRGTVSFANGYCVGVFRNEQTERDFKPALEYLQNAPKEVIELAAREALRYVLDIVNDEPQPFITTAFWGSADGLYTNDTLDDFLGYGGYLLETQVLDVEAAISILADEEYEFEESEVALLKRLYERKIAAPEARITLTEEEISMLNPDGPKGVKECKISFKELGIYFEGDEDDDDEDDDEDEDEADEEQEEDMGKFEGLRDDLSGRPKNTPKTAYEVKLDIGDTADFKELNDMLQEVEKYVSLDLSGSTVTEIPGFAFENCTGLTGVTIPNSVTSIETAAFRNCENLTGITIGKSVTSIEEEAFSGCKNLKSITIPKSVTSIERSTFYHCTSLASVTIPNRVTSIEGGAFEGCTGLTGVTIPNSVNSIGYMAFYECTSLASVTIGNSVNSIGREAFYKCKSLAGITLPSSVISIDYDVFDKCTSLTSVTFLNKITSGGLDERAFYGLGDLQEKYLANGRGTYTRENGTSKKWTKQ